VFRVLIDGLVVTGQKPLSQREIVKPESAGLGGEVHVETGLGEHLERMQRLGVEQPGFRFIGINHAVVAADSDQRFAEGSLTWCAPLVDVCVAVSRRR
jgi:hypothetical protein